MQKTMPNPDVYVDDEPLRSLASLGAVAVEIWTVDGGYVFDNFLITRSGAQAAQMRDELWKPRHHAEVGRRGGLGEEGG